MWSYFILKVKAKQTKRKPQAYCFILTIFLILGVIEYRRGVIILGTTLIGINILRVNSFMVSKPLFSYIHIVFKCMYPYFKTYFN